MSRLSPYLRKWTPRRAERWCHARIDRMDTALLDIAGCWGDVNDYVVRECDRLRDEFQTLRELVTDAKEHELHPDEGPL